MSVSMPSARARRLACARAPRSARLAEGPRRSFAQRACAVSLEPTPFTFDASLALEALVGVGLSIMGADDAAAGRLPWTLERAHAQLHLLQKRLGEPPEFAPTTRALRSDLEALSELMRDADKEPLAPALGGRVLATALVVLSHLALFEPASTQAGESMALAAPAPWTPPGEG